jgi:hypothetical protein
MGCPTWTSYLLAAVGGVPAAEAKTKEDLELSQAGRLSETTNNGPDSQ